MTRWSPQVECLCRGGKLRLPEGEKVLASRSGFTSVVYKRTENGVKAWLTSPVGCGDAETG